MLKRKMCIPAICIVVFVFWTLPGFAWAQCPEAPNDHGVCDTIYVEIYPPDQEPDTPPPFFVRFPIYVTHDVPDSYRDSIAGFYVFLCYESSNTSKYCSLTAYWNNTKVYPNPELDRSVFRHLPDMDNPTEHNWMMELSEQGMGLEWDSRVVNLYGNGATSGHFWMALVPLGEPDQRFGEGSRVLLATMTFKLEDTTTICIDNCISPPGWYGVTFSNADASTYHPRDFLPVCEYIGWEWPPPVWFRECPGDESQSTNGTFTSEEFEVMASDGDIIAVAAQFSGNGITDVNVVYTDPPPYPLVRGRVEYTVTDHCQEGGRITITAWNDARSIGYCHFDVMLSNNYPLLNLPVTWRALVDYTLLLTVSAGDSDNDSVEIVLDAFWYEPDSLQAPTNPPSYDGGNPGLFTWVPAETDTGTWICSFSATDVCGAVDTHQIAIGVGFTFCGDCTNDTLIDLGDVIYLINYLFKSGPPPEPLCRGDANCDGERGLGDVVLLINYLYKRGFPPCFECCAELSEGGSGRLD